MDVLTGHAMPAGELVHRLLGRVREVLGEDDETAELDELYARMRERGSPAQRQPAAYRRRRDLRDVVDDLLASVVPSTGGSSTGPAG